MKSPKSIKAKSSSFLTANAFKMSSSTWPIRMS